MSFFVGGAPRLRMEEVIYTPGDRFRLQTVAKGVIHLQLGMQLVQIAPLSANV